MRIGSFADLNIESVAFGGHGVARKEGLVVFIPFTVDGDLVRTEITSVRKNFATGKVNRIIKPSPFRTKPRCKYFRICGGCQYQHIKYSSQIAIKKTQIEDCLRRIGQIESPTVLETIPSPLPYGYRGKAEFHAVSTRDGIRLGFFDAPGTNVIDIARCEILDESINAGYDVFRESLISPPSEGRFIFWSDDDPAKVRPIYPKDNQDTILRKVKDRVFKVPASGFFQGNPPLTPLLVETVLQSATPGAGSVLDLYCGSGLFSLFLSGLADEVIGIEADRQGAECARENFSAAGLDPTHVLEGQVENILGGFRPTRFALIVLDPPRSGCDKDVLRLIARLEPKKIIYISCDPATQARDLKGLILRGFVLRSVQPLDMFPQTSHVETVTLLERN